MLTNRPRFLGSRLLGFAFLTLPCLAGCYGMHPFSGGAQVESSGGRSLNTADIALPPGYKIEAVASGPTFPTGVTFDDAGRPCVVEAGLGGPGLGPGLNDKPLPAFAIKTQVRQGAGAMPAFSMDDINDEQLDALVTYLEEWRQQESPLASR